MNQVGDDECVLQWTALHRPPTQWSHCAGYASAQVEGFGIEVVLSREGTMFVEWYGPDMEGQESVLLAAKDLSAACLEAEKVFGAWCLDRAQEACSRAMKYQALGVRLAEEAE